MKLEQLRAIGAKRTRGATADDILGAQCISYSEAKFIATAFAEWDKMLDVIEAAQEMGHQNGCSIFFEPRGAHECNCPLDDLLEKIAALEAAAGGGE